MDKDSLKAYICFCSNVAEKKTSTKCLKQELINIIIGALSACV